MLRRKNLIIVLCFILLASIVFPFEKAMADGQKVKIGTDSLNVRTGPGLSYPVLGMAQKGESFTMISKQDEWIEIDFGSGQKGWVADWLVVPDNGESETAIEQKTEPVTTTNNHATVTTDGLRVRGGPSTEHRVLGLIEKNKEYRIVSHQGGWVELETQYGNGWVSSEFLNFTSSSAPSQQSSSKPKSAVKSGTITTNSLNIRSEPSQGSALLGKFAKGDKVEIISQQNDWTEISYNGASAWISSQYVQAQSSEAKNSKKTKASGGSGKITATSLNVRETPSLNGKNIGTVSQGQTFSIIEEQNNWAKIEYESGVYGWVAGWFLEKDGQESTQSSAEKPAAGKKITILQNGSNVRQEANTSSQVIERANQGDVFEVVSYENDWYEIKLSGGKTGFIAGWIVSSGKTSPNVGNPGSGLPLQNKTIVLDPGHGGRDNGTTGASGTLEKTVTMATAELLASKLKAAGANVVFTRQQDTYVPLQSRVSSSHMHNADAFLSIHYDSIDDRSVRGMTTYYYHDYQQELAADVHSSTIAKINIPDRGHRQGDYFVIRENNRKAILLELGYLSNPAEEMIVSSPQYQEAVATGIFQGLARHFSK